MAFLGFSAFIGIDTSLRDTGLVVLDNVANVLLHKSITTRTGESDFERIDRITTTIFDNVNIYIPPRHPESVVVVIEDHAFGSRTGKAFTRAELSGVIKHHFRGAGVNIVGVAPTKLKQYVAGTAKRSESSDLLVPVFKRWGFYTKNHNVADAYGCARLGHGMFIEGHKPVIDWHSTRQIP